MIIKRKLKYKEFPYSQELINKYKSKENMLSHARYIPGKTDGIFLVDNGNNLVGYIGWEGDTIISLEVSENYRKQGIGTYLLKKAIENGITNLTVSKKNTEAINLYKSLGWKIYRETQKIYFMKYDEEETVTLYHVTKKENVPSILREGLKGSKATESSNTASMKTGLPIEKLRGLVYLSRDLNNLGAMELNDKRVVLKVEVPIGEFKKWRDIGDPIRNSFKNKYEWTKYYIDYVKKNKPEFLIKIGGEQKLRNLCLQVWENVSPENTMVLDKDIPPKYISVL